MCLCLSSSHTWHVYTFFVQCVGGISEHWGTCLAQCKHYEQPLAMYIYCILFVARVHENKSMQRLISSLWGTGTAKFQVTWLLRIVQKGVSMRQCCTADRWLMSMQNLNLFIALFFLFFFFFFHENSQEECIRVRKLVILKADTLNDESVHCKKTDSLGA